MTVKECYSQMGGDYNNVLSRFYDEAMIKRLLGMTSVLNVIGVSELFLMAKTAGGAYYKYFESYIVISIIYFVLCFVFNRIFAVVEKKLQGRSDYELATEFLDNE